MPCLGGVCTSVTQQQHNFYRAHTSDEGRSWISFRNVIYFFATFIYPRKLHRVTTNVNEQLKAIKCLINITVTYHHRIQVKQNNGALMNLSPFDSVHPACSVIFCLYLPLLKASKLAQYRLSAVSAVAATYLLPSISTLRVIRIK